MSLVAPASSIARLWPPRPTVQSTKTPPRSGCSSATVSATSTGSCSGATSDSKLRQRLRVVVGERLAQQLCGEALVVPDFEIVVLPEHVDIAGHPGRLTQPRMEDDAALGVDLGGLTVVVDAIEVLEPRGERGGHPRELFLERKPDRHGIHAYGLPREARHEQFDPVLFFHQRTEGVRDLEPSLVIDSGGVIPPEHDVLLHFAPQKSTAIVEKGFGDVNRKIMQAW